MHDCVEKQDNENEIVKCAYASWLDGVHSLPLPWGFEDVKMQPQHKQTVCLPLGFVYLASG